MSVVGTFWWASTTGLAGGATADNRDKTHGRGLMKAGVNALEAGIVVELGCAARGSQPFTEALIYAATQLGHKKTARP
jgi:hypothetical protein